MPSLTITPRQREYRSRKQRNWKQRLRYIKRYCARCGQTNFASLRIIDLETGRAVGLNASTWWKSEEEVRDLLSHSEVLCTTCQVNDSRY